MKSPLSCFAACLALATGLVAAAHAQDAINTPNGAKSDATSLKLRQIDLLVQLLPLAIRKDQFNPLLTSIEYARSKFKEVETMEDADLAKIDGEVTEALNSALTKGVYPPKDMQVKWAKVYRTMAIRRQVAVGLIIDKTVDSVKSIFDAGQLKVMANSLDPYAMDPSIKKDSLNEDGKIRFFVNQIILDPAAYDLVVQLHRMAP